MLVAGYRELLFEECGKYARQGTLCVISESKRQPQ